MKTGGALLMFFQRGSAPDVIPTFPGETPENAAKMAAPPEDKNMG